MKEYLNEETKKFIGFMEKNYPTHFSRELNAYHARVSYRVEDIGEKYDITVAYDHSSGRIHIVDRAYESEIGYIRQEAEEAIEEELCGLIGRLWIIRIDNKALNQGAKRKRGDNYGEE